MWIWSHSHLKNNIMLVYVNNEAVTIDDNENSVSDLLRLLNKGTKGLGVGINNKLVKAKDWDSTRLRQYDRVTLISASYGG